MDKKYLSRDKIVGKDVIDSNAIVIGNVKDIALDLDSKNIALTVLTKTGEDITIDGEDINVVGDVVLLNKIGESPSPPEVEKVSTPVKPQAAPQSPTTSGLCGLCTYQNDVNAKFCIKCGNKLSNSS